MSPFGTGNLVNLDLAAEALKLGRRVYIATGIAGRDYTSGKQATAKVESLNEGRRCVLGEPA